MPLKDPFAAYNAAHNVEAELVRNALVAAGIEAHFTEDLMSLGIFAFGPIPEIHRPQVWIERADADRAAPILAEFERRSAELRGTPTAAPEASTARVEQACEECGKMLSFPAGQEGSVQECMYCGAYVDVGGADGDEDWGSDEESGEAE
jgi:hypothetical protein